MTVNFVVKTQNNELRYFNMVTTGDSGIILCVNEYENREATEPIRKGRINLSPNYWKEFWEVIKE